MVWAKVVVGMRGGCEFSMTGVPMRRVRYNATTRIPIGFPACGLAATQPFRSGKGITIPTAFYGACSGVAAESGGR